MSADSCKEPDRRRLTNATILAAEILLASAIGLTLVLLGAGPTAWVIAGITAGAVVFRSYSAFVGALSPNKTVRKTGQALVGLSLGFSVAIDNLDDLIPTLAILISLTASMVLAGGIVGYTYSRLGRTDLVSALFATMPGGVGIMASVAADYGRNASLVALVQAARVAAVVVFISFLVGAPPGHAEDASSVIGGVLFTWYDGSYLVVLLSALLVTYVTVPVATYLRVPVAPLLAAMAVGIAYSLLLPLVPQTTDFTPPELLDVVGQLLLGLTIGEYLGNRLDLRKNEVLYGLGSVAATILLGLIVAYVATLTTSWDWLTCVLVAAPGGAPEMIVLALALDQEVEIVTVAHVIRQLAVNGLLPFWILLFQKLERNARSG